MPGSNLTQAEARERAALLEIHSYDIDLDLTDGAGRPGEGVFRSRSVIRFTARTPGAGTFVDVRAERVHAATLNGTSIDVSNVDPEQGLALTGLAAQNELVVEGEFAYTNTGEGLHRFLDPVDGEVYLYSQFETADAHRVYACFDQPDLKATFTVSALAPTHWEVVSNGAATDRTDTAAGRRVSFATTARMSPYVTALVAGPYHSVRRTHDGIDLGVYCRQSLKDYLDSDEIFTITEQGFDFYHRTFGHRYAFGKYDQLFVPEFNAGAMENAGCVTFLEDYLFRGKVTDFARESRASTILHEMAHMWFGDLVTMRWWDDLWLNESFAEWASHLVSAEATRFTDAWTSFCTGRKAWGYRQDQLSSTHPIACEIVDIAAVEVNFDGITYAKGASVLKQLVAYVGREEFVAGLRAYFDAHALDNATLADLLGALERSSGRDLAEWSSLWLEHAGVNTLRTESTVDIEGRYTGFAVLQEAPESHPTLRPHRIAIGLYDLGDTGLTRRRRVEIDIAGARTAVDELVGERPGDLVLLNDDDLTFTKIRLDERSLAVVTDHIGELTESLPRALCWAAAWDMTRDGEMAARDYLHLVLAGIDRESTIGVVQMLLRQALVALASYADPAWAAQGFAALADAAHGHLLAAEEGSDRQLTWARAFASAARGDAHLALLRGLLVGTDPVPGLAVDVELRWHLLQCLVANGAAGDGDIDAELERDSTDRGHREAATARALRPDLAAKDAAWLAATEDDALANQSSLALIRGFSHPTQDALLEPYTQRYFDTVAQVWTRRSSEVAQNVAIGLYPSWSVCAGTVEASERFLADESNPPSLRRLVAEGRDGVVRALHARERDSAAS